MNDSQIDVYFLSLEINNFRCFKSKQILDFSDGTGKSKKWTIILGDNGTGKTSLLQLLAAFEIKEELIEDKRHLRPLGLWSFNGWSESLNVNGEGSASAGLTCYYEPNSEISWKPTLIFQNDLNTAVSTSRNNVLRDLICYGYGANRFMSFNSLSESKSKNSETLFDDDAKLINAEEWLLGLDYTASKESEIKVYAERKRDQVKEALLGLLPDEIKEIRFSTPTKERPKPSVEFLTPYGWVSIHQLSLGYKTMVAWIVDLAYRLFERYPDSDNPLAELAVVLVDEIDLHLHPKWQRKIFSYLSARFPQTQFIVTAHSPLVVQSAPKDANIVLLRREGDHVIIDQNLESVRSWRLDQILTSDLFGISDRDTETEQLLDERKNLLQKIKLTPEEAIRLSELNDIVDNLPTADSNEDRKAMEIIRKAAEIIKNK